MDKGENEATGMTTSTLFGLSFSDYPFTYYKGGLRVFGVFHPMGRFMQTLKHASLILLMARTELSRSILRVSLHKDYLDSDYSSTMFLTYKQKSNACSTQKKKKIS
jgi:hypothetical protein